MDLKKVLQDILASEYEIHTVRELADAIRKQERIDVSMFCAKGEKLNGKSGVIKTERVAV